LLHLKGIGRVRARSLFNKGFTSIEALKRAQAADIARVVGIGDTLAASVKRQVGDARGERDPAPEPQAHAEKKVEKKKEEEKKGQTSLFDF
jgi:helicase